MKRFLILLSLLFCNMVYADTINLHWLNDDGTTYENSTCVIDSDLILPSTPPTKYGYTFTGWKIGNYIPIEYLEGTGTQWIDTGTLPTSTQKWVVGLLLDNFSDPNLFGASGPNGYRYVIGGLDRKLAYNFNKQWVKIGDFTVSVLQKLTIDIKNKQIYLNDTFISNIATVSTPPNQNIYLFLDSTAIGATRGKLYYAKIYENDVLIRDFIPVLDFNGIPCMYDKVENKFYYNQGTGNFIAGPTL